MRGGDEFEKRKGTGKMKLWQIWVGYYHFGQGSDPPTEPQMVGEVEATTFDLACLKHELMTMYKSIQERDAKGEYVDFQSRRWFYDWDNNSNSWTGKYFETKEEAATTFK